MTKFRTAGVQPFGVNPASIESHQGYVEKMHFNFPLLSDPDRAIANAYHAVKEDGRGIQRTVYVIGTDGTVESATMLEEVDPLYNRVLLAAAKNWVYRPARLDNTTPVKYRKRIQVAVTRPTDTQPREQQQ